VSTGPDHTDDRGLPARRAALAALAAVDEHGAWSTTAVPDAVGGLPDDRDRRFASHLAYDTIRWSGTLDWLLSHALTRPLDQVEPSLRRVLRLGTLQLWRTQVPARAAVSTSVALAREAVPRKRAKGAGGFVNGVLRGLSRRLPDLAWPDPDGDPVQHLALTTGHPAWLVAERLQVLGPERTATLLHADNVPPGVTLRAVGDRDALVEELRGQGIDATPTPHAPEGVRAPGADPRRLACVAEGRAVPQDEASMLVVRATGTGPGDRVLDLCAGPGGKTGHLATLAGPTGRVTAVELHAHRAERVREVADRLGVDVDVRVGDARDVVVDPPVDVALVDAPCTGLGTGRRRPEVRWRRTAAEVADLAELQVALLRHAIGQVRPGGRLAYAVCTWTRAETTAVVEQVEADAGARLRRREVRQLGPDTDGTDGMFVATWDVVTSGADLTPR
jgi:16S rRNA (cytosine967-C5)-methyltransferase